MRLLKREGGEGGKCTYAESSIKWFYFCVKVVFFHVCHIQVRRVLLIPFFSIVASDRQVSQSLEVVPLLAVLEKLKCLVEQVKCIHENHWNGVLASFIFALIMMRDFGERIFLYKSNNESQSFIQ